MGWQLTVRYGGGQLTVRYGVTVNSPLWGELLTSQLTTEKASANSEYRMALNFLHVLPKRLLTFRDLWKSLSEYSKLIVGQ